MKHTFLIASAFFVLSFVSCKQKVVTENPINYDILVPEPIYVFPDTIGGDTINHVFTFYNKSNVPVTIDTIISNCNCTDVYVDNLYMEPEEQNNLYVSLLLPNRGGVINKSVTIIFDSINIPYNFTIKGEARQLTVQDIINKNK